MSAENEDIERKHGRPERRNILKPKRKYWAGWAADDE
jgi:hypothetical protein